MDTLNLHVKNSDVLFIGRFSELEGYYETIWLNLSGENSYLGEVYVWKFRFTPSLVLKGNVKEDTTVLWTTSNRPISQFGYPAWSGSAFSNGQLGELFLIFANKPNEKNIVRSGWKDYNIKTESSSQVLYSFSQQSIVLPEANYVLEGNTSVERAISVLSQAYAVQPHGDKNQQRGIFYLYKILEIIPRWKILDVKVVMYESDWDGPQIYDFFREKIQPRLFNVASGDPILKARALFMSICTGDLSKLEEYKQLVNEIDKTHPKTDDEHVPMGLFGDKQYALKMMNARLDSIRSAAFSTIDEIEMPKAFRYGIQPGSVVNLSHAHIELAVNALQNDPSWQVQIAAASWLNAFRNKYIETYRDAPVAKIIKKEVTNKQTVIDYWLGK